MQRCDQFEMTICGSADRCDAFETARNVLLINPDEIDRAGLEDGQVVSLVSDVGDGEEHRLRGLMVVPCLLPDGCVGAYYPNARWLMPLSQGAGLPKAIRVRIVTEAV